MRTYSWRATLALIIAVTGMMLAPSAVLGAPQTYSGSVSSSGVAWRSHEVTLAAPVTLEASLDWAATTESADLSLFLKGPDGTMVAASASQDQPEVLRYNVTNAGAYKWGVKAVAGAADYTITVSEAAPIVTPRYSHTIGQPRHAQHYPSGLDVDADGNVYLADTGNDQVVAYSADGREIWRTGRAGLRGPGNFSNPRDVAFADGRIYVADTDYGRIQVLDADTGSSLAVWPTKYKALMGVGVGVDANGERIVLVCESGVSKIHVYTPDGTLVRTVGSGYGSGPGQLKEVRDAATSADGTIYAADFKNHRVAVFNTDGTWRTSWGSAGGGDLQFREPYGVVVHPDGTVYVSDNNRIRAFTGTGEFLRSYGQRGEGPQEIFQLRRVAVLPTPVAHVYAADLWGRKYFQYDSVGAIVGVFGGDRPAGDGFNETYGLDVADGQVFTTDVVNQRVQRWTAEGTLELAWGKRGFGTDNLGGLNWPRGIAYDSVRNTVWVADTKNWRITEFSMTGEPTGRSLGSRGANDGKLGWVYDIEVAPDGDLIIADTTNHRVQRWNPDQPDSPVEWSATALRQPLGVALTSRKVYVADTLNHRVVVLDAATGARLNTLGAGTLKTVEGIAVASDGTIWVSEPGWNRLTQLSASGDVLQHFGRQGTAHGQFNTPAQLAVRVTPQGDQLLVSDSYNDRVEVFSLWADDTTAATNNNG